MKKQYLTAREVAEVCGVSDGKAYGLIREMNAELKAAGYMTLLKRWESRLRPLRKTLKNMT